MLKMKKILLASVLILTGISILFFFNPQESSAILCIKNPSDLIKLFPKTASQIQDLEKETCAKIDNFLTKILALPKNHYFYKDLIEPLDDLRLEVGVIGASLGVLTYLSPDSALRTQAQISSVKIDQCFTSKISLNKQLYLVLSEYIKEVLDSKTGYDYITAEQRYFMQNLLAGFKRSGLDLPDEQLAQVTSLLHELTQLEQQYVANLGQDRSQITVTKDQLIGVPEDFVNHLSSNENGELILKCDDNSYIKVMSSCENVQTREKYYRARTKRAYPQNLEILKDLIAKRDALAQVLGFASYAHLDLDDQMVLAPENAKTFLFDLLPIVQKKAKVEIEQFKKDLPSSVKLKNGKIKPWDLAFIKDNYKRKYLNLDEQLISEYFEQTNTIAQLLRIYEQFLGLQFKNEHVSGLWANPKDLKVLSVYETSNNKLIGYLILDLFPRADKLPHPGAQIAIIPPVFYRNCPAVSVILANFNRAQGNQPALMTYQQVRTFFHEFGHAMHALLGKTELASQAGINVKTDFVEMPSQMLECWLSDATTIAQISKHYQTGKPLPNELINNIIQAQNFDTGDQILRQINLSLLSLDLYGPGPDKDFNKLRAKLEQEIYDYMVYDPQNMLFAAFLHIATSAYGAKYYGYLWSRVFASDLFAHIKEHGLDNPAIGSKYVQQVLSKGGSCEPLELLTNFLGRAPNQEAFKKELGF